MSALPLSSPSSPLPPRRRWPRILLWTATALLVLLVAIVAAGVAALHSARLHRYLLGLAQSQASAAIGAPVAIQNFQLHLSLWNPSLDIYGLAIAGAAPYAAPPLLQVPHIAVAIQITSLLHRRWYFNSITIDQPAAYLLFDRNGRSNLPSATSSSSSSSGGSSTVFDLGVRHFRINHGVADLNQRAIPLDADLRGFAFQAAFDPTARAYAGRLSYREGRIAYAHYPALPHAFSAQFRATARRLDLDSIALALGPATVHAAASVADYTQPQVHATYQASLDATQLRRLLALPQLPSGAVAATGALSYLSRPGLSPLDTLSLQGNLSSPRLLLAALPGAPPLAIRDLAARFELAHGDLALAPRAAAFGGQLAATLQIRSLAAAPQSTLRASARNLDLAQLAPFAFAAARAPRPAVAGRLTADTDATWSGALPDLHTLAARVNASLDATLANHGVSVPVAAALHAAYSGRARSLALQSSYLRTPHAWLAAAGALDSHARIQLQFQSNDLHELEALAPLAGVASPNLGLYGAASFTGTLTGATNAPHLAGQLRAANLQLHGTSWKLLQATLAADPSRASAANGQLVAASGGSVRFALSAALRDWSFTSSSPFQASFHASQLSLADLARAAGVASPLAGSLSADLALHGTERNPVGQGSVTLARASLLADGFTQPISSLVLQFQGNGQQLQGRLTVQLPAGVIASTAVFNPRDHSFAAQLQTSPLQLHQLQPVAERHLQLFGLATLAARASGTFAQPTLHATLAIPSLKVQNQTISGITLQADLARQIAHLALDSQAINTSIHGRAVIDLAGDDPVSASLDTQTIPLQPLVALYAPSIAAEFSGQTEIHASLLGPLLQPRLLAAHILLPVLRLDYSTTVQLAAAAPIRVDFVNQALSLQPVTIRGTDTDLRLEGTVPLDRTRPVSLLAQGTVDLQLAQLFDSDVTSSGQLQFNINSYGQTANPNLEGEVRVVNANLALAGLPAALSNANGVLTLTRDRLQISNFSGAVGGGTVTAQGGIAYRPALQFDLAVAAKDVRLLYPASVRETLGGNLALAGTPDNALLRGQINLAQLSVTPAFDLTSFIAQAAGGGNIAPPPGSFAQDLALNIAVASVGDLSTSSKTFSLNATASLRVRGTAAEPVILGRVNLNSGDLIFMGNRYILQNGGIDFVNPARTDPVVNLAADTTIQQYDLHIRFQGPADSLRASYSSDPALPPADIINLLAFGQTTESSGTNSAPGNLAAENLIASGVSSQITSRFQKIAGISQLSIDPVLGANQQNPGARITVQQRVSSNLFVTFSTDVTGTQQEVVEVQYQLTPTLAITAVRDQNGGFGFDTRLKRSW